MECNRFASMIMRRLTFFLLFFSWLPQAGMQAQTFQERETSVANTAMTVNNLSMIGNAFKGIFRTGSGSAEWPRGSAIEHAFQGGLWVGGKVDGQIRVTTAYLDNPDGYDCGTSGYELTPKSTGGLQIRSSLPTSANYDPKKAISHEDLYATATDENIFCLNESGQPSGTPIPEHTPLGIEVDMEFYNWSFTYANFFVIGNFTIRNVGDNVIDSVYVGYLTNGVVRNTNVTPAGQGGSAFYNKGGNGYLKNLTMAYDWDRRGDPNESGTYFAQKYLGSSDKTGERILGQDNFQANYNVWIFQATSGSLCYLFPGRGSASEPSKYERLINGLEDNPCWDSIPSGGADCGCAGNLDPNNDLSLQEQIGQPGNRSNMVSTGPYATLQPGDSIQFTMAFLFANQTNLPASPREFNPDNDSTRVQLRQNAQVVQSIYDNDFQLPEPPPTPFTFFKVQDGKVIVEWSDNAEVVPDPQTNELDFEGYRLYITDFAYDVDKGAEGSRDPVSNLSLLKAWDMEDNDLFYDNGFTDIRHPNPYDTTIQIGGMDSTIRVAYRYEIDMLQNGWQYGVALTVFDRGNPNIESLESAPSNTMKQVFPGTQPNGSLSEANAPYVYPNPYYAGASWEGSSIFPEDRRLNFANLPANCTIKIFTPAGDVIDEIEHSSGTYTGNSPWYDRYSDQENAVFAGGEHSWNLISADNQIISRGIYLYTIEQNDKIVYRGKFVVIK